MLRGMSLPLLSSHVEEFIELHIEKLLYFPAWSRLELARHTGEYTCILSNGPDFLVSRMAKKFKVDAWQASEYPVDKDQKLCQIQKVLEGEDKARHVRELADRLGVSLEDCTAYSDSELDLPFLHAVGKAVTVNPDRRLKQVADRLSWEEI